MSLLQITQSKAHSYTKTSLPMPGIDSGTFSSRGQCAYNGATVPAIYLELIQTQKSLSRDKTVKKHPLQRFIGMIMQTENK